MPNSGRAPQTAKRAKDRYPPADQVYGYRSACVKDCGGNRWTICALIEDLTSEEMHKRIAAMIQGV